MPDRPDITVVIAEDDLYSCDLMAFLLARDRRIRVIAEGTEAIHAIETKDAAVLGANVVLLDTELPGEPERPFSLLRQLRYRKQVKVICTGTAPDEKTLRWATENGASGYILKDEVHYALGAVVVRAMAGSWVTSPGVMASARRGRISLPRPTVVINGARRLDALDDDDRKLARLAILFNQPYKDIGDELGVGAGHVGDLVSALYDRIGLTAILEGQEQASDYFSNPEILALFEAAIKSRQRNARARSEMKTLAFHLLTLPEIETT